MNLDSIKSTEYFLSKDISQQPLSIKQLDEKAEQHKLSAIDFTNHVHKVTSVLHSLSPNKNVVTVEAYIDLDAVFQIYDKTKNKETIFQELEETWCGYYDDNNKLQEDWFITVINTLMNENKIIFVFLDLYNYFVSEKENPKYWEKGTHESLNHSTSMLFYPKKNGIYNLYHFNSHGEYQLSEMSYYLYITRKRAREVKLPVHLDGFIISSFVEMFNKTIPDYLEEPWKSNKIIYNLSKDHNYYGTNLQCIDNWGICYLYPFILWYELKMNLTETNLLEKDNSFNLRHKQKTVRRFTSYQTYLRQNNVTQIIFIAMSKYFPEIREIYLNFKTNKYSNPLLPKRLISEKKFHEYSDVFEYEDIFYNNLEILLEYKGEIIIHNIYSQMIQYLTQPAIIEACKIF